MPDTNVVTLAEAKDHLRIDGTDDDTYITALILGAVKYCEEKMKQCFLTQTITEYFDCFPADNYIELEKAPLAMVTHVKYTDHEGEETTMAASDYVVDSYSFVGKIVLAYGKSWPTATLTTVNAVEIQYTAGYGENTDVPQMIKLAIMMLIGHWYANREAVTDLKLAKVPVAVDDLLGLSGARVNI